MTDSLACPSFPLVARKALNAPSFGGRPLRQAAIPQLWDEARQLRLLAEKCTGLARHDKPLCPMRLGVCGLPALRFSLYWLPAGRALRAGLGRQQGLPSGQHRCIRL